jgi:hypothetical protein
MTVTRLTADPNGTLIPADPNGLARKTTFKAVYTPVVAGLRQHKVTATDSHGQKDEEWVETCTVVDNPPVISGCR